MIEIVYGNKEKKLNPRFWRTTDITWQIIEPLVLFSNFLFIFFLNKNIAQVLFLLATKFQAEFSKKKIITSEKSAYGKYRIQ